MLLLNRVVRNFTILILLLSSKEIIIDVIPLVVGVMPIALICLVVLTQIDGKRGAGGSSGVSSWPSERIFSGDRLSDGALSS